MNILRVLLSICITTFASGLYAQTLHVNGKSIKVDDLPEYVIINCDNVSPLLGKSIRIVIQAKNSEFEPAFKTLENLLEDNKYLKISNQTDLLNAMSKLGFDYVNAFPQNLTEKSSFSRTGFVFRKKDTYRN